MYPDYAAVERLSAAEQHQLLRLGDAPERLWAAWALAFRAGADAVRLLERADLSSAPSGLKCHVVVILAGLGRRDLLQAIALHDTSLEVRAVAVSHLIRTASGPAAPDALSVAEAALLSPATELRETILQEHVAGRLALPDRLLLPVLFDRSATLRQLAWACAARKAEDPAAARKAMIEALVAEADPYVLDEFVRDLPPPPLVDLLARLALAPADRILVVLAVLARNRVTLSWPELEPLSLLHDSEIVCTLANLLTDSPSTPALVWVAERLADASPAGKPPDKYWRLLSLLESGLTREVAQSLTAEVSGRLFAVFLDLLRQAEMPDEFYDLDEQDAEICCLKHCLDNLRGATST